jgi:hypothetical protein
MFGAMKLTAIFGLKVETMVWRRKCIPLRFAGYYAICYGHGETETLVDKSDDEIGHEYEVWEQVARQHARDNTAEFRDLT